MIAIYVIAIGIITRVVYEIVIVQKDGPVLWTIYRTHGVHEGDLPAIIIGIPLGLLMLLGILREVRALGHGRKEST
ncbi:MAG: hypothetical protein ACR2OU_18830 [Thermomicrobiales bacterium]